MRRRRKKKIKEKYENMSRETGEKVMDWKHAGIQEHDSWRRLGINNNALVRSIFIPETLLCLLKKKSLCKSGEKWIEGSFYPVSSKGRKGKVFLQLSFRMMFAVRILMNSLFLVFAISEWLRIRFDVDLCTLQKGLSFILTRTILRHLIAHFFLTGDRLKFLLHTFNG